MDDMTFPTVVHLQAEQRYELHVDGEVAGILEYREREEVRDFLHTHVRPRFEGRYLARRLVRRALDDARASGMRVRPVCPYVTRLLDRSGEYADIDVRARAA